MSSVALVQTQVLMAMPVPNIANRLIFSTRRLGRFLISQSGMGFLVVSPMVTLAWHLWERTVQDSLLGFLSGSPDNQSRDEKALSSKALITALGAH